MVRRKGKGSKVREYEFNVPQSNLSKVQQIE